MSAWMAFRLSLTVWISFLRSSTDCSCADPVGADSRPPRSPTSRLSPRRFIPPPFLIGEGDDRAARQRRQVAAMAHGYNGPIALPGCCRKVYPDRSGLLDPHGSVKVASALLALITPAAGAAARPPIR